MILRLEGGVSNVIQLINQFVQSGLSGRGTARNTTGFAAK